MTNDAFVAFFTGLGAGVVLGIMTFAILAVIRQNEDRREQNEINRRG